MKKKIDYNAEQRRQLIKLAKKYTNQDISLFEKNSNISHEKAVHEIAHWYIGNEIIRRIFLEKAEKLS